MMQCCNVLNSIFNLAVAFVDESDMIIQLKAVLYLFLINMFKKNLVLGHVEK